MKKCNFQSKNHKKRGKINMNQKSTGKNNGISHSANIKQGFHIEFNYRFGVPSLTAIIEKHTFF